MSFSLRFSLPGDGRWQAQADEAEAKRVKEANRAADAARVAEAKVRPVPLFCWHGPRFVF